LTVAHAVVQQHAVLAVEAAVQVHAAQGVVFVAIQLAGRQRRFDTSLGVAGQQCALFLGPAELPAAKRDQPR